MQSRSSLEKWPTPFSVVKAFGSSEIKELTLFLVTGMVNGKQYEHVEAEIGILSVQDVDSDKLIISTLINQQQLENLYKVFEPRSREWRGQYYSLANAIVRACEEVLEH